MKNICNLHMLAGLLVSQIDLVSAYWRLACSVANEERIDPIISPGYVSSHVHKIAGGININANSTGATLQSSNCSTCQVQADHSGYWTPSMYYEHPDGTFESVPNDGMTVYYVGRGGTPSNTQAFPPGFKMLSGNPFLRSYNTSDLTYLDTRPVADRVSFRCINEANDIPETHYINDTNCVNGLRAQINFQSCWDGVNLYLENSAHVAYLSGIDYGVCPPSHPVPIPGLFFEVLYWVNDVNQRSGGRFVLSNGDPTGYSFHGDFLNGWTQSTLEEAVQNCLYTDNGGVVDACAALVPSNDVNFARTCPQALPEIPEQVYGNLTKLPGCNPVETNPELIPTCAATAIVSAVDTVATATSQEYASIPAFSAGNLATLSAIPATVTAITSASLTSIPGLTTTSDNTHAPLLTTASLSLQVSTLTTFVTITRGTVTLPGPRFRATNNF